MPTYLQKLNQQVNILIQEGKYSEAIPLAESGLAILEKVQGKEHPNVAKSPSSVREKSTFGKQGDFPKRGSR